jgi:hypothetical protein
MLSAQGVLGQCAHATFSGLQRALLAASVDPGIKILRQPAPV